MQGATHQMYDGGICPPQRGMPPYASACSPAGISPIVSRCTEYFVLDLWLKSPTAGLRGDPTSSTTERWPEASCLVACECAQKQSHLHGAEMRHLSVPDGMGWHCLFLVETKI